MRTPRRIAATVVAAVLVTTGVTLGPATPAVASAPYGAVDVIGTAPDGHLDVVGWAVNPGNPGQPVNVWLYLMPNPHGGYLFGMQWANLYRADVGAHGFNLSTRDDASGVEIGPSIDPENPGQFIFPGPHNLCVMASTGYATTQLGCRQVNITQQILSLYWP
ncbi:hypothetical protein [Allorhizocola rhizosphaerae]|uniref:hypothetical protein n=1 Tax=Allorhizocola rhizosphaerae TaxID=1872709 RepID=UPI000E3EC1C4|nr:hypothetical protein [Allorhizocola rhizosphaerae]